MSGGQTCATWLTKGRKKKSSNKRTFTEIQRQNGMKTGLTNALPSDNNEIKSTKKIRLHEINADIG